MPRSTPHTVGEFLFDYLYKQGVDTAFGIPGDFVLPTVRYLEDSKIRFMTMTHEPSVGFAADVYARIHGLGVACVTYCVGGLNMLNSIACAYAEKSPVVVISGGPSPSERQQDPLIHHKVRTFDTQRRIFEEVTCANTILLDPDSAADEIIRVIEAVKTQCRPGYIEIPYDIVDQPIRRPRIKPVIPSTSDPETLNACIAEVTEHINRAKKPVLLAGVELQRHGLTDMATAIAKKFNIPIAATLLSKSVIRETNPLYIGVYSGALSEEKCRHYIDSSDCVIMLGTFITDVFLGQNTAQFTRQHSILVTTEQARVGLHSYDSIVFSDFLTALGKAKIRKRKSFTNPNPVVKPKPLSIRERDDAIGVEDFFRILSGHIPDNSTLVCDTGDSVIGAMSLRTSQRRNFIADAYYLTMGFAVPGSVGAMAAAPDSRAFVIVGDGAFQMTGMELSTMAKYQQTPIIIIINNDGYGTQRHIIDGPFNNITRWDYSKVTDMIGYGTSFKVTTKGELHDALSHAVVTDDLFVIELIVPRDDCSKPLKRLGQALHALRNKR